MKIIFNIFLLFIPFFVIGQDVEYARKVIKTLSANEMEGRGYVNNGMKKAADFLIAELKTLNIKTLTQDFEVQANSLPVAEIKIDNIELEVGKDFSMDASASKCKGTFELVWVNNKIFTDKAALRKFFAEDYRQKFLVFDTAGTNLTNIDRIYQMLTEINVADAKGIIEIKDAKKIIFYVSRETKNFPVIKIAREKISKNAKNISVNIKNKFHKHFKTQNICGILQGKTDSFLVFTAHYDHLGRLGNAVFSGANDNASGCAMLLMLAKHFAAKSDSLKYSVVFLFTSCEEIGLVGARYFAENPLISLNKIKFLLNFDMVGSGSTGIVAVNGAIFKNHFQRLDSLNSQKKYFEKVSARGEAANSDHFPFYQKKVPCFFIYTTGNYFEYHNVRDVYASLPLTKFSEFFKLIIDFVNF